MLNQALEDTGWPCHALGVEQARDVPIGLARLARLLVEARPDLLHTHLFHAALFGAAATLFLRVPQVQTHHYGNQVTRFGGPVRRHLDRWATRRCVSTAAVSASARAHLIEGQGLSAERVTTIHNGVDWNDLSRRDREIGRSLLDRLGVPRGPLLGCAASLLAVKGHRTLIEAFARVRREVPNAQLVLLGRGPEERAIRELAARLGVAEAVHLLGHREDSLDAVAAVDVYLQPSVEEGFGLAVIEAMAMRKPVVVSRVGGLLATVEHERSGYHVDRGDSEGFARRAIELLGDRGLADRLGAEASRRVHALYSLERVVRDYDSWYRTVLGAPE
jgi:glycosyltransferase involved in cell wall biosynthesis